MLEGPGGERAAREEAAAGTAALLRSGLWNRARVVGLYADSPRLLEFPTSALLAEALSAGKRVYYPRVEGERMQMLRVLSESCLMEVPPYGLREPCPEHCGADPPGNLRAEEAGGLDLLLVPGMAFDRNGQRLGRGGGFYDRFIAECAAEARESGRDRPLLVGLCYSAQVSTRVPIDTHDARVDIVLTGTGCFVREDLPAEHLEGLPLGAAPEGGGGTPH